jgi:hypothetical protein
MTHTISFVQEHEYNRVSNENIMLKAKITELYSNIDHLHEISKTDKSSLNLFKEENNLLKQNLSHLEQDIQTMKNDHILFKNTHHSIIDNIYSLLDKDLYNKFMIAIQDINRMLSLEQQNTSFKDLREDRIYTCHYMKDHDSQEMKDAKITVLYEKLHNMKDNIREDFNNLYPNVIEDVLLHISPVHVSDKLIKRVNKWWN